MTVPNMTYNVFSGTLNPTQSTITVVAPLLFDVIVYVIPPRTCISDAVSGDVKRDVAVTCQLRRGRDPVK